MSGRGQQAAVARQQRRQARPVPSEQAASGRQAASEPEARPWWIDLLIDRFDAKLEAEIKASELRLVKWVVGTVIALFAALQIWPPGG